MIKEIHCFGTSYTEGGGFEFDSNHRKDILSKIYKDEPKTKFNYSYPGQLQKLVGDDIKVFNHAKSGYGNERMYRLVHDMVSNTDCSDKLFLLEFSSIGRKEVWSNTKQKHLIINYVFNNINEISISGMATDYFFDEIDCYEKFNHIFEPFLKETIDFNTQVNLVNQNSDIFIDYLLYNNINFIITAPPLKFDNIKLKSYIVDFKNGINDMVWFAIKNKLTITDETRGMIKDGHGGYEWSKIVAKKIVNKLI
jgi:hypothetical protein